QAVAGLAAIEGGPTSSVTWLIVNLHGDVTATINGSATGLSTVTEYSEYGTPKDPSQIGGSRYGWLGSEQRAADTPGGAILMGARIYEPSTGRFASVDPVYGG